MKGVAIPKPTENVGKYRPSPATMDKGSEKTHTTAYRGKEHGEGVDSSFQNISAPNGQDHGWQKHEVAQAEQQCGQQLESVGERIRTVGAAPAPPPCGWGGHRVEEDEATMGSADTSAAGLELTPAPVEGVLAPASPSHSLQPEPQFRVPPPPDSPWSPGSPPVGAPVSPERSPALHSQAAYK